MIDHRMKTMGPFRDVQGVVRGAGRPGIDLALRDPRKGLGCQQPVDNDEFERAGKDRRRGARSATLVFDFQAEDVVASLNRRTAVNSEVLDGQVGSGCVCSARQLTG